MSLPSGARLPTEINLTSKEEFQLAESVRAKLREARKYLGFAVAGGGVESADYWKETEAVILGLMDKLGVTDL